MPLDFTETEKAPVQVDFFNPDSKTRPQHLEGEVIPELIRRASMVPSWVGWESESHTNVGDIKANRLACSMVEQYLEKNVLIFDPALLKDLFKEADYKAEGSLDTRALAAALSGRYPKRRLTKEWRQLVALLLGVQELVLTQDIVNPKLAKNGTFNAQSSWSQEPPPLPPITRRRTTSAPAKEEFQKPTEVAETGSSLMGSTWMAPRGGAKDGDSWLLTTAGQRTEAPSFAETSVNQSLMGGSLMGGSLMGGPARCTFQGAKDFGDFSRGLEAASHFGLSTSAASTLAANAFWTEPPRGLRAWSTALPPTAISLPVSTLEALRNSVRSTTSSKPGFATMFRSIAPCELDLKKTLGQPLDVTQTLNRVEPTRPTETRYDADYLQWSTFAPRGCKTMPSAWFNEHPSLPAAAKVPCKYPWGTQ